MAASNKIRHPKKRAFLAAYAQTANITQSAKAADVERGLHYVWMQNDPVYAAAFESAKEEAAEYLEQEARRRAVHGVDEPVFYQGEAVGKVRKYSDTLLIFLMKGAMPDKYKDRVAQEHSGQMRHEVNLEGLSEDELRERINDELAKVADLQARTGAPPQT
ncbi:hypothetical protein [Cohnella sp. 56]|uniref:hypothetical protein n=1 Tax=Cohnella sp. 56 TaxID=3113722 RepID=UPI0030E7DB71